MKKILILDALNEAQLSALYKNLDLGRQFILLLAYFGVENDEQTSTARQRLA